MNNLPDNRADARLAGTLHFFTGRPCKRGHMAKRHTGNRVCVDCDKLRARREPVARASPAICDDGSVMQRIHAAGRALAAMGILPDGKRSLDDMIAASGKTYEQLIASGQSIKV